jgi:hypothetical protein
MLTREETLAFACALILTLILCAYSLYLKQQESAETIVVSLSEYAEVFDIPSKRQDLSERTRGRTKREITSAARVAEPRVARDSGWFGETAYLIESRSSSILDSLTKASGTVSDSSGAKQSLVFRPYRRSLEFDSISRVKGEAGALLLRQHLFHESQIYDTLLTSHLIRLGNEFTRSDMSPTLESQMKFDVGRYGSPYNPLRPQPPSAQIKVKGIVIALLDFIYAKAKEVTGTVTRVIKPREKKPTE